LSIFLSFVTDEFICLQTHGLYPEARIDVEVSSDDDTMLGLKPDVPADKNKKSTGNDIGDGGVSSAEPIDPNLTSSDVPK
jgi:hypothetical protein